MLKQFVIDEKYVIRAEMHVHDDTMKTYGVTASLI